MKLSQVDEMVESFKKKDRFFFPRIIHQIWITDPKAPKDPPEEWDRGKSVWMEKHPNWLYIRWDTEMCREIAAACGELMLYDSFPYLIQRCDVARYFILLRYGGMYVDMDIVPAENIERFFTFSSSIWLLRAHISTYPWWVRDYFVCVNNDIIISQPGALFLKELIQKLRDPKPWWSFEKHLDVMTTTGPLRVVETLSTTRDTVTFLPYQFMHRSNLKAHRHYEGDSVIIPLKGGGSWIDFRPTVTLLVSLFIVGICAVVYIIFRKRG